ncbi:uncharacterized protein MYCFIDRAFT_179100 [Pseudocercospora fijiensis CIRAD86]|uniref:Uncharacterized protein n=1 Tax=Pseudocercospora fijiensis (strain CIRAD86) TaxID=383855 RepID=M3AJC4_PSEFD|nr:uncharacterized protein MYCFIDRAFT_179100 [Pseudocercospora fijiensis CIRAD86]EME77582.1 hypothetical protein MYCFIDRAFT_179100 [Pseudocercospora fijiensis CIRAD86]
MLYDNDTTSDAVWKTLWAEIEPKLEHGPRAKLRRHQIEERLARCKTSATNNYTETPIIVETCGDPVGFVSHSIDLPHSALYIYARRTFSGWPLSLTALFHIHYDLWYSITIRAHGNDVLFTTILKLLKYRRSQLFTRTQSRNSRTSNQHTQPPKNLTEAHKMTLPVSNDALTSAIATGAGRITEDVYERGKRIVKGGSSKKKKRERELEEWTADNEDWEDENYARQDALDAREDALDAKEDRLHDKKHGYYYR